MKRLRQIPPFTFCICLHLLFCSIIPRALGAEGITLHPTFNSCGVVLEGSGAKAGLALEYRPSASSVWKREERFPYFALTNCCRGSLLGLEEDTSYELRIVNLSTSQPLNLPTSFRTWSSEVPIAETRVIDPAAVTKFPISITNRGSATGWIRYVVKDGAVLKSTTAKELVFDVNGAEYVVFDDMTLCGATEARNVIKLTNAHHVRIRNCEIYGWSRVGVPRFDLPEGGKYYSSKSSTSAINSDPAININTGCQGIVVERCYIHDPLGRSSSWYYSHPAGPQAVMMYKPDHTTVLRYNDFVGSDQHRWNDAVESSGNFHLDGGFNREADVYGNYMSYCDDDCIELDGGMQNVRCFGNRFENALCGVSIQGCMVSPTYVFDNLFSGMADEQNLTGQTIKTDTQNGSDDPVAYVWGNRLMGRGSGMTMRPTLIAKATDNELFDSNKIGDASGGKTGSVNENNVACGASTDWDATPARPVRPLPFVLSRVRVSGVNVREGRLSLPAKGSFDIGAAVFRSTAPHADSRRPFLSSFSRTLVQDDDVVSVFDLLGDLTVSADVSSGSLPFAKTGPGTLTLLGASGDAKYTFGSSASSGLKLQTSSECAQFVLKEDGSLPTEGYGMFTLLDGKVVLARGTMTIAATTGGGVMIGGWTAGEGEPEKDVSFVLDGGKATFSSTTYIGTSHGFAGFNTPVHPAKAELVVNAGATFVQSGGKSFYVGSINAAPSGKTFNSDLSVRINARGTWDHSNSAAGLRLRQRMGQNTSVIVDGGTMLETSVQIGDSSTKNDTLSKPTLFEVKNGGIFKGEIFSNSATSRAGRPAVNVRVSSDTTIKSVFLVDHVLNNETGRLNFEFDGATFGCMNWWWAATTDVQRVKHILPASVTSATIGRNGLVLLAQDDGGYAYSKAFIPRPTAVRMVLEKGFSPSPSLAANERDGGIVVTAQTPSNVIEFAAANAYRGPTVLRSGVLTFSGDGSILPDGGFRQDGGVLWADGKDIELSRATFAPGSAVRLSPGRRIVIGESVQAEGDLIVEQVDASGREIEEGAARTVLTAPLALLADLQTLAQRVVPTRPADLRLEAHAEAEGDTAVLKVGVAQKAHWRIPAETGRRVSGELTLDEDLLIDGDGVLELDGDWIVDVPEGMTCRILVSVVGTGRLVKRGRGALLLSRDGSYSGGTVLEAGTVRAEAGNALGSGTLTVLGQRADYLGPCSLELIGAGKDETWELVFPNDIVLTGNSTTKYPALVAFGQNVRLTGSISAVNDFCFWEDDASMYAIAGKYYDAFSRVKSITFGPITAGGRIVHDGWCAFVFDGKVTASALDFSHWRSGSNHNSTYVFNAPCQVRAITNSSHNITFAAGEANSGADLIWNAPVRYGNLSLACPTFSVGVFSSGEGPENASSAVWQIKGDGETVTTLVVTGAPSVAGCETSVALGGKLALTIDAAPDFVQTFRSRSHTLAGALSVNSGTLRTRDGATFAEVPRLVIGKDGRIDLEAGTKIVTDSLCVNEREMPAGTYFPWTLPCLVGEGRISVKDASGKVPLEGAYPGAGVVREAFAVVGSQTWKMDNDTLAFDNALRCLDGVLSLDATSGGKSRLVFRGTNVIDGAIVTTSTVIEVSGLLATPGHIDQGKAGKGGGKTITVDGNPGKGYLYLTNAVIEKPVFLRYNSYSAIVCAAGTTNVMKGSVTSSTPWFGFTTEADAELVFEGGLELGWSLRSAGLGTVRIREKPMSVKSIGWNIAAGELALDVAGNNFYCVSTGYQDGNSSRLSFGASSACDTTAGAILCNGYFYSNELYKPMTRGTAVIDLGATVQQVNSVCGSALSVFRGEKGARLEILRQIGTSGSSEKAKIADTDFYFASAIEGEVTLRMLGEGNLLMKGRTFETTGGLIVENGSVELASDAIWKGGTVEVRGTGVLRLSAAGQLQGTAAETLLLGESGRIEIPSGVTIEVGLVKIWDGAGWIELADGGDFGAHATGVMAGRISGGGTLRVKGFEREKGVEIPLEWNPTYATGVPYETEVNLAKLHDLAGVDTNRGFIAQASVNGVWREIGVTCLPGRQEGLMRLRILPPAGTDALVCRAGVGVLRPADAATSDNLFDGALAASDRWTTEGSVRVEAEKGGIVLSDPVIESSRYANFEVAVPESWRGHGAQFEIDVTNEGGLPCGGAIRIRQYADEACQNALPESVTDPRWTSHTRPVGELVATREHGRIHPEAVRLRLQIEVRGLSTVYGGDGLPLRDVEDTKARIRVSHLALRLAEELPFPKYDDAFFDEGVSGASEDRALVLGGDRYTGLFFATRSSASWAENTQLRKEEQLFFPSAAGTVEAWFKPSGWPEKDVYLFEAHHSNDDKARTVRNEMLGLKYLGSKETLTFTLKDVKNVTYKTTATVKLPVGQWSHVAVTWKPGGAAAVFVNGNQVANVSTAGMTPLDLAGETYPNDEHPLCFYLGCHSLSARNTEHPSNDTYPFFNGSADLLRISTGVRYDGPFVPAKALACDTATRALFAFDRSFDGVSGGGIGFIRSSVRTYVDTVCHRLSVDGKTVQYFPDEIREDVNPAHVLDADNYKRLPGPDDFLASRISANRMFELKPGETAEFALPEGVVADYVEIANNGSSPLLYPLVLNEGEINPTSYDDLRETLHLDDYPPRARADRILQYAISVTDYYMTHNATISPDSNQPSDVANSALTLLNSYCGFECGPLNTILRNIFTCSGRLPSSPTQGYGHSFCQVFYEGRNRLYDLSGQSFYPSPDNESTACLSDVEDFPATMQRIGRNTDHYIRNGSRNFSGGSPAFREKAAMTLNPGERFRVWFANDGEQNDLQCKSELTGGPSQPAEAYDECCRIDRGSAGGVWRVNRFFPEAGCGFLVFDGVYDAANPAFAGADADSFVYAVHSVHPIVAAEYLPLRKDGSRVATQLSVDRGRTWLNLPDGFLRYEVRARTEYLVRVMAPPAQVVRFRAVTEVQVNSRSATGKVRAGANALTLNALSDGDALVSVGYRTPGKRLEIKGGVYSGTMLGSERQLVLVDPANPVALRVEGASVRAKAAVRGPVTAVLADGVLTLSAAGGAKGFAFVEIVDGECRKELTVLVAANARLLTAGDQIVPSGTASFREAGAAVQPCVWLYDANSTANATFSPLPNGRYAVLMLDRFESHPANVHQWQATLSLPNVSGSPNCCAICNDSCMFYKAHYGTKGVDERSAFKWDYPVDSRYSYYLNMMNVFEVSSSFSSLSVCGRSNITKGVELAAVLIVPVDKQKEESLYCDLVKILCGLNCQPNRVSAGEWPTTGQTYFYLR